MALAVGRWRCGQGYYFGRPGAKPVTGMIHRGQFLARGNLGGAETLTYRVESDVDKFWSAIPQTPQKSHPISQSENPAGGGNSGENWK
jgi:hypothetical protein